MATVLHTFVYFMACFFAFLPSIVLGDLIGHGGMVRTLAFSSDGRKVLSGSFDFSSVLWDFEEQREIASFDGHSGPVHSVGFITGSNRVASTGDDGLLMHICASTGFHGCSFGGRAWTFTSPSAPRTGSTGTMS